MTVKVSIAPALKLTFAVKMPVTESMEMPIVVRVALVTGVEPAPVTVIVSIWNLKAPVPFVAAVVPPTAENPVGVEYERPDVVKSVAGAVSVIVSLTMIVIEVLELEPTRSVTVTLSYQVPRTAVGSTFTMPVTESIVIPVY